MSISSNTIQVSGLTVASGSTVAITYGDTSGGGLGALSPSTAQTGTFTTSQKGLSTGTLTAARVVAPDSGGRAGRLGDADGVAEQCCDVDVDHSDIHLHPASEHHARRRHRHDSGAGVGDYRLDAAADHAVNTRLRDG